MMTNMRLSYQYAMLGLLMVLLPVAKSDTTTKSNITFSLFATAMSGCDFISDCDLMVYIHCSDGINEKWDHCGQTSEMSNDNNPVWPEVFTFEHTPGTDQYWRFEIVDVDFIFDDLIAVIDVAVNDYAAKPGNLVQIPVPDNTGIFWIHRRR